MVFALSLWRAGVDFNLYKSIPTITHLNSPSPFAIVLVFVYLDCLLSLSCVFRCFFAGWGGCGDVYVWIFCLDGLGHLTDTSSFFGTCCFAAFLPVDMYPTFLMFLTFLDAWVLMSCVFLLLRFHNLTLFSLCC